jgi:hypothetical protein
MYRGKNRSRDAVVARLSPHQDATVDEHYTAIPPLFDESLSTPISGNMGGLGSASTPPICAVMGGRLGPEKSSLSVGSSVYDSR